MVLTVSFVLSPVTGLSCHRRRADRSAKLDTSVGASGPHDFAVRDPSTPKASTGLVPVRRSFSEGGNSAIRPRAMSAPDAAASTASRPASVTIAIRPLCPEILAECANGRLIGNRPLLELSPLRPKGDRACLRARDSSGVFLNPNSCKGFEPAPSKEGSG